MLQNTYISLFFFLALILSKNVVHVYTNAPMVFGQGHIGQYSMLVLIVWCRIEHGEIKTYNCFIFLKSILGEYVYTLHGTNGHAFSCLWAFIYAVFTIWNNLFLPFPFTRLTSACLSSLSLDVTISEKLSLTLSN